MLRLVALLTSLLPATALGQNKGEPTRRDLVAAIRKKLVDHHSRVDRCVRIGLLVGPGRRPTDV